MVPAYIAARLCGMNNFQAAVLGASMNTSALMELIVLNIGYDLGFLPHSSFTMLVVMAVVATLMSGPRLNRFLPGMHAAAGRDARSATPPRSAHRAAAP